MLVARTLALLLAALVATAGVLGCKGKCRTLSERLCDCSANSLEKDACLKRASNQENNYTPTNLEEAQCNALLGQCDCRTIDTPEGKVKCGLARDPSGTSYLLPE